MPGFKEGYQLDRSINLYFTGTEADRALSKTTLKANWTLFSTPATKGAGLEAAKMARETLQRASELDYMRRVLNPQTTPAEDTINAILSKSRPAGTPPPEQPKLTTPPPSPQSPAAEGATLSSRTPPGPGEPKRKKVGNITVMWDKRQQQWVPENTVF
jgi:hypothetical protein